MVEQESYIPPEALSAELLALFSEWSKRIEDAYPSSQFEEIYSTSARPAYRKQVYEQLEQGYQNHSNNQLDSFTESTTDLSQVYILLAPESEASGLGATAQELRKNHTYESLATTHRNLMAIREEILAQKNQIPDHLHFLVEEYLKKIDEKLRYCQTASKLFTSEFTASQKSEAEWAELIDIEKSLKTGKVSFPYEQLALDMLQMPADPEKTRQYPNFAAAFQYWKLSEAETSLLNVDPNASGAEFPAEQIKIFFEILLDRLGLREKGWEVTIDPNYAAIDVGAQRVTIPASRVFTPDELVFIPAHEFVHAIGGENGRNQEISILGSGLYSNLTTEEGKAVTAEMIAGEKFGHPRQRKMAARYWAIAQSLKTLEVDGVVKPLHTLQDIYNQLRDFQIETKDAQEIIWRFIRGTSLQRKVVPLAVNGQTLQVCEAYVKDMGYFVGQIEIFEYFKQFFGPAEEDKDVVININDTVERQLVGSSRDFSRRLLFNTGSLGARDFPGALQDMFSNYNDTLELGRSRLLDLMQLLLVGGIRLDTFEENFETWMQILKVGREQGMIIYSDLFGEFVVDPIEDEPEESAPES